jgi:hypothetical protein
MSERARAVGANNSSSISVYLDNQSLVGNRHPYEVEGYSYSKQNKLLNTALRCKKLKMN